MATLKHLSSKNAELISMLMEKNNFHDFETFAIYKWILKAFIAVYLVTHTFDITMAIFELAQNVVQQSAGIITGTTSIDFATVIGDVSAQVEAMEIGELFGLLVETLLLRITMPIMSLCVMLVLVLNHTYEYTIREDILMTMEYLTLPEKQAAAFLESPSPLADVYKDFQNIDIGYMDHLRECIEGRATRLLESQREATRSIPLYQQSGVYAREHGELEAFRASHQANVSCRDSIQSAIRDGFDGMHLSRDAAKDVLAEFGPERVAYVLAATVRIKEDDLRFSQSNRQWAHTVPMSEPKERRYDYLVDSHPAVLDGFIGLAREEMERTKQPPQRKPSIKEQLTAKPVPGTQPTKPKDREVR